MVTGGDRGRVPVWSRFVSARFMAYKPLQAAPVLLNLLVLMLVLVLKLGEASSRRSFDGMVFPVSCGWFGRFLLGVTLSHHTALPWSLG